MGGGDAVVVEGEGKLNRVDGKKRGKTERGGWWKGGGSKVGSAAQNGGTFFDSVAVSVYLDCCTRMGTVS